MKDFRIVFVEGDIERTAEQFLRITGDQRLFAFFGAMGAGKTTFIKALCNIIGTDDLVSSPTFAIVNEYSAYGGGSIYHFDFYRIKSSTELLDIGFYEYLSNNNYCFIEWSEKAEELLEGFMRINIDELSDGKRVLSFRL